MNNPENDPFFKATDDLLLMPDLGKKLTLIDRHIMASSKDPDGFQLPPDYETLQPIVNKYREDLPGFVQYLRELRDEFPNKTAPWREVQLVYRKVNTRLIQRQRRERMNMAFKINEEKYEKPNFHDRLQWLQNIETLWAKKRLLFLAEKRYYAGGPHLNLWEVNENLNEFWLQVDKDIANGVYLLPWDFSWEAALEMEKDHSTL